MIATLLNFSTNEAAFLRQCLEEVVCFSDQIVGLACDHFFDGTPEDQELLYGIYQSHPNIQFIQYPFSRENFYSDHSPKFWHNINRMVGAAFLEKGVEYVLFLDVDEIPEGNRVDQWLSEFAYRDFSAIRLACHWYFREPTLRAQSLEDTPLLIRKNQLTYDRLMQVDERAGMFALAEGKKLRFAERENPLFHHYSWVRSKEGLLKKATVWGHRDERNWVELIEKEFDHPFSGTDFVHGYSFDRVPSTFSPAAYEKKAAPPSNVHFLTTRDVHKIDLALKFT